MSKRTKKWDGTLGVEMVGGHTEFVEITYPIVAAAFAHPVHVFETFECCAVVHRDGSDDMCGKPAVGVRAFVLDGQAGAALVCRGHVGPTETMVPLEMVFRALNV